ncbi:HesA/MoeB/ThiF family protein [Shewanella algidipiscicola]|uniref:Thiamine biosynthesis protein ThiF n=1 Tax=Shewanella algidipiscicola TaxID=614070 RepID=A0ABQ4PKS8_9GAMM|nr:HesA/MoeB/ThiF family protein [Shewanella algidipiscicola]GIU48557.1 thiamine biosynthesis protein ThiF [Shewanella algidipiscicola]
MALDDKDYVRYSRHIMLPEMGEQGQQRLSCASAAIIGLGGLGMLCAQYLAGAGIGSLLLIDGDKVESSNLPRQLLFDDKDIGHNKALVSQHKLQHRNPSCQVRGDDNYLGHDNAVNHLSQVDVVIDCSDNFMTRQLVNATCVALMRPNVVASVAHFSGQLLCIDLQKAPQAGCYHCLFPQSLKVSQGCDTQGVLGPMVGVMASMQTLLAMQILLQLDDVQQRRYDTLYRFNGLGLNQLSSRRKRDPQCAVCAPYVMEKIHG